MQKKFEFSEEDLKKLKFTAISEAFECTPQYVGQILRNEKGNNEKSRQIREYAQKLLSPFKDPIKDIEVVEPEIVTA